MNYANVTDDLGSILGDCPHVASPALAGGARDGYRKERSDPGSWGLSSASCGYLVAESGSIDGLGTLVGEQRYLPFGEVRGDVGSKPAVVLSFTGQRALEGTGLIDYKARQYDPSLRSFIQPDPIIPNPYDVQDWNRYAYVHGNPLRFIDPSGNMPCDGPGLGSGCDGGNLPLAPQPQLPQPVEPQQPEPWNYSQDLKFGYHIGSSSANVPDQSSDDFLYDAQICGIKEAAPFCLIALIARFGFVGPQNTDPNFWIQFTITYDETKGISITDMTLANYSGDFLEITGMELYSGENIERLMGSVKLSNGFGSDYGLPDLPRFDGKDPIEIILEYKQPINTGSAAYPGPSNLYPNFKIILPAMTDLMYFMQSGKLLPTFP